MRRYVATLVTLVALFVALPLAAQTITVKISKPFEVLPGSTAVVDLVCEPGDRFVGSTISFVDGSPSSLRLDRLAADGRLTADVSVGSVAGRRATIGNSGPSSLKGVLTIECVFELRVAQVVDSPDVTIGPQSNGGTVGACPAPLVPVGQVNNVDNVQLVPRFVVFLYGNTPLDDLPDGEQGPPTALALAVRNPTAFPVVLRMSTACASIPNARTLVFSSPTTAADRFAIPAIVPSDREFVASTFVGGLYGNVTLSDFWGTDGTVTSQTPFVLRHEQESITRFYARGQFVSGVDTRARPGAKASARAVVGVIVVPAATAPPAPSVVPVVEFYHAALDHYFITAIPGEIADLDRGTHPGWQRTGQTFNAYGAGSTGPTTRRPVCRAYGNPAAGLDSHFYSASTEECLATLANFGDDWLLEASEVFQLNLPDPVTGACPAGNVPIYRLWNGRADSNHRYVASIVLRDQMRARGWTSEGYGPQGVALCALS